MRLLPQSPRRRAILGSLTVPFMMAVALAIPSGLSENVEKDRLIQDQREAHEAHCLEQQAKQEAKLAAGADKVEKVVADGKPATKYTTRYVFGKDGGAGKRAKDVGLGSFELAHAGGPHALESAYSPLFDDWYLYFADMSILHWASDPCGGWDDYAFAATVGCAEDTPTFSTSPCLYDAWIALQRSADGSTWTSPWGYSHRKNASPRASCYAQGGRHGIPDYSYWVRTWLYLDGSFTEPSPDHPFNARKSTSTEMWSGPAHTTTQLGPCYPDWCDATTPPTNDPHLAFNNCNIG
jgi:hypothetical protein